MGELHLAKQEFKVYHGAQREEKCKKSFQELESKQQDFIQGFPESRKQMVIEFCSSSSEGHKNEIFSRKIFMPAAWNFKVGYTDIFYWLFTCDSVPDSFKSN